MNIAYIAFEESSRINPLDPVNCAVLFNKISIVLFGRMAQLTDILIKPTLLKRIVMIEITVKPLNGI